MKIGIANTFSYRPHNRHLVFLAEALKQVKGVEIKYVSCDGSPSLCNTKIFKGKYPGFFNCMVCKTFGLGSFVNEEIDRISVKSPVTHSEIREEDYGDISLSTIYTTNRIETHQSVLNIKSNPEYKTLNESTYKFMVSVISWIEENEIEAVVGFNGRMDLMRAFRLACEFKRINFITVERPWFGHGLLLVPNEGPLGVKELARLHNVYRNCHLKDWQLKKAVQPIAKRICRLNKSEFMQFNEGHKQTQWSDINENSKKKVLFLPSSRMETLSEVDFGPNAWTHPNQGLKLLFVKGILDPQDLIVRFHPIWAKELYNKDASETLDLYTGFCEDYGIAYIKAEEKVETNYLIQQADYIVLNGSSSFFEASILGKPIISLVTAFYDIADLACQFRNESEFEKIFKFMESDHENNKSHMIRKALRFLYTFQYRYHQYTSNVFHIDSFSPVFNKKAANIGERLLDTCRSGHLQADCVEYDDTSKNEDLFIEKIMKNDLNWTEIAEQSYVDFEERIINRKNYFLNLVEKFV